MSAQLVPGRECGSCMLCCKLFDIKELAKPPGVWCGHAKPGRGCGIYGDRPGVCSGFYCGWRTDANLGPEWRPEKAKFFIADLPNGTIMILVDPGSPNAWRGEQYYPTIKVMAGILAEQGRQMFVQVGRRMIAILPDRDLDAGLVPLGQQVRVVSYMNNGRADYKVVIENDQNSRFPTKA